MKTLSTLLVAGIAFWICTTAAPAKNVVQVSRDVPFGNAANIKIEQAKKLTTVRFSADPHGGPESLWFCFRVTQSRSSRALGDLRLVLECPETMLGGGRPADFRPVYRFLNGDWERSGAPEIVDLPDGRQQAVWTIHSPTRTMDFAFSYPYGKEEILQLIQETRNYWHADTIGVSQGGRPLLRLSNDYGTPQGHRPGIYLIARQHSGEVSASWVLDGVLRRFAELGKEAPLAWVVPLANIDGVEQGDYGKDNFPYDLNRAWGNPPMRHETLVYQQDLRRWSKRCGPALAIDFHAPGASEKAGIYAFLTGTTKSPNVGVTATNWANTVAESLGTQFAAKTFLRSGDYASRWNTPRFGGFCQEELGVPGFALEVPYALIQETIMTREQYREAGKRIADALVRRLQSP